MSILPPTPDGVGSRVRVEFVPGRHVSEQDLAGADGDEMAARAEQALEAAMHRIREVVERVTRLQAELPNNFRQMQVDFGIKFDWEAGALLANNQQTASINVKLTWDRDSSSEQAALPALLAEVPVTRDPEVPITPSGLIQAIEADATTDVP